MAEVESSIHLSPSASAMAAPAESSSGGAAAASPAAVKKQAKKPAAKSSGGAKKSPKAKPVHPKTSSMVMASIKVTSDCACEWPSLSASKHLTKKAQIDSPPTNESVALSIWAAFDKSSHKRELSPTNWPSLSKGCFKSTKRG